MKKSFLNLKTAKLRIGTWSEEHPTSRYAGLNSTDKVKTIVSSKLQMNFKTPFFKSRWIFRQTMTLTVFLTKH